MGSQPTAKTRPISRLKATSTTPRDITNAQKKIIWQWHSDPFGTTPANEDPDGDGKTFTYNLRFAGQYYDPETGLHYNYFRDYNPKTGRYMESDPIGLDGGLNTYGYVGGNPVNFVDPLGLDPICASDGQRPKCSDGMSPPPKGTPLNGPLSPIGIGATAVEMCPVPFIKLPFIKKIPESAYKTIQTGRTTPNSLKEKLAMDQVMSNPQGSTPPRIPSMSDTKNGFLAEDGWVKRVQNVNGVEVHYIENTITGQTLDFKFKN